eukprot:CAMPEP_0115882720 /NCGR_PEP_ID=MMETSP0287-20121206/29156_1 /TAXON_ID=412157 /ORGANISM="Chrysochromulina rotalis, Strain UIO044" /LENGTH=316 /DNA_ID=CAMNT_0003338819 /DNA_START=1 /DNA_END=952 /DNA_ORIENTATION=-
MHTDNFTAMMAFKRAFRIDRTAWRAFEAWRKGRPARPPSAATADEAPDASANGEPPSSESDEAPDASANGEPPSSESAPATSTNSVSALTSGAMASATCGNDAGVTCGNDAGTACGAAAASSPSSSPSGPDPGLERLHDDPELQAAAAYLPMAFEESSMEVGLLAQLSHADGHTRTLGIWVSADGVRIYADEDASSMAVTCNIMCEREVLMQIIRGELDATAAITSGMVMVDDLGQLMAFKMAFKLDRAAFDAYLASKNSVAPDHATLKPEAALLEDHNSQIFDSSGERYRPLGMGQANSSPLCSGNRMLLDQKKS